MILVTGANGFIGSYLVKSLVNIFGKDRILALTSHPIEPCNYLLHNNYNFDSNIFVKNGFEGIETIIHAGAFTPKLSSDSNNIEGSFSNINGTHKLISASYPNLKRIIFLSTIDVYGDDNPITETSPVIPISLYGHSKLYCEEMIKAWADKMNISSTILRIGHVYGPGEEKYKKLIPIVFQKILSGEQIRIFGNGRDIRTFIFISDVVCAIIRSVELKSKDEIINVVGDEQVSINDLIEKIIHISERDVTIVHDQMVGKVRNMVFDNIKMVKLLCPLKVSLNEGLKSEWEYFAKMNIFFDLDGTLLDSRERLYKLFCDLTKQSILDLNQYWNLKRAMHDHRKILNEYCNYSFDDVLLFEAEWMKLIEAEEYLRFDLPFPFTVNVLKRLKSEKIDLHMVTSRQSRPGVMRQLERLGLYSFFTNILVTESVMTKSQLIIDSNVYLTDKDIFVGDTGLDIKTAKVIGIRSLAVLSGFRNKSVLAKYNPEYIENDIRAVLNYV